MDQRHTLSVVIREALAQRGISTLRAAAEATGIDKDALQRRYNGQTSWTVPDLDKVCAYLGVPPSELMARSEGRAA